MNGRDEETLITEDDVRSSSIERRTFIGKLGLAAGLIGVAGMTQACGSGSASDSDQMEASDSDQMEASDSDSHQEETEESSDSDSDSDSGH